LVAEEKKEEYIGIDIKKTDAVDYVVSATDLKYEDNKIENIYEKMCLAH
jgi:predicted SAM-dependent methyltransferase